MDVPVSFKVNPALSRFYFATQKKQDGTFLVNSFCTDGGGIPRNVILKNGLLLVDFGALTLQEFVLKSSYETACRLGLTSKGHFSAGADADITIADPVSREAVSTFISGQPVLEEGKVVARGGTIVTTPDGADAVRRFGLHPGWWMSERCLKPAGIAEKRINRRKREAKRQPIPNFPGCQKLIPGEHIMIWIGLAIVILTFYLIYKNYEARLVLALSGILMAAIGWLAAGSNVTIGTAVDAFVKQLVNGGLVPTIVTVMGFGAVMTYTHCSDHLVNALVRPLTHVPAIVIPGAAIITWLLNIVLPSAAGVAAAVGVLLIPSLIALRVNPVMAAAAVFLGTWGSAISPGLMFNPQVADIAFKAGEISSPDAMIVIFSEALPAACGAVVAAITLAILSHFIKEGVGTADFRPEDAQVDLKNFHINPIMAVIPIVPLFLLVIASKEVGWLPTKTFSVPVCMLIGTALGLIVAILHKQDPGEVSKQFCKGAGDGFNNVVILIAAASLFAAGMKSIGLTGSLIDAMKGSQSVAMASAVLGPFIMAIVCGSGNAAALAFNEAITPHAADFGMTIVQLGAVAQLSAGIGRTISPIAGGLIVLCGIAHVNPMEVVKRTALPCVLALIVVTAGMYFF